MDILSSEQVRDYLDVLCRLGKQYPLVDIHTHATEIIFDELHYVKSGSGIYSVEGSQYQPPTASKIRLDVPPLKADQTVLNKISKISFSRAYQHIGSQIMVDQMALCGVSRAAVLPVAREGLDFDHQWRLVKELTADCDALILGYCIPANIPTSEIKTHLKTVVSNNPIKILKIHPNLSNISLKESDGIARIEAMLEACNDIKLPSLIHGGCSPILHNEPGHNHATLSHLSAVDWSLNKSPMVIAHFGAYGCKPTSMDPGLIDQLVKVLEKHDNIVTDTSGVPYPILVDVLRKVDLKHVVYGSDALYYPMWQSLTTLAHALHEIKGEFEEGIRQVAHVNTRRILNAESAIP